MLGKDEPDFDSIKDLTYLNCVVYEVLRLSPPVPIEMKLAVNNDTLPSGHKVEKGDMIMFLPFIINREERIYSEPEEFRPERWLDISPTPFEFLTFNAGPRMCLGKFMAITEIKILMAMILQKYGLSLKPNHHPIEYELFTITLPIRNGLHVQYRPRD